MTALTAGALVLVFLPETAGRRMPDTLDECEEDEKKRINGQLGKTQGQEAAETMI